MIEKHIDIPTADGRMDSFVVHPEEGGAFPAVIVLMDIWGLREELYDVARRVAAVGYHVTLPNFWYRRGKVRFEYEPPSPIAIVADGSSSSSCGCRDSRSRRSRYGARRRISC